jgi:hypothetical protein
MPFSSQKIAYVRNILNGNILLASLQAQVTYYFAET